MRIGARAEQHFRALDHLLDEQLSLARDFGEQLLALSLHLLGALESQNDRTRFRLVDDFRRHELQSDGKPNLFGFGSRFRRTSNRGLTRQSDPKTLQQLGQFFAFKILPFSRFRRQRGNTELLSLAIQTQPRERPQRRLDPL